MSYFLYKGQIAPALQYRITTSSGGVYDLTGKTVQITTRRAGSSVPIVDHRLATITVAATGDVEVDWLVGDTDYAGTILAYFTVISAGVPEDTPEFSFPIYTHSVPWCSAGDVAKAAGVTVPTDGGDLIDAALGGTDVMHSLLARQFRGVNQDTIRPSRVGCACWLGPAVGLPLIWGFWGGWMGWGSVDQPSALGCGWLSEYVLSYPVQSIVAVKIDGVAIPTTEYRVDEERRLVRLPNPDGTNPGWPACQDMSLDDTKPGTWSVTYQWGQPPPRLAVLAAAELGAQFYNLVNGKPCQLPVGTTKVTRAGVTIERGLLADWTKGGSTGLPLVDAAIRAFNPNNLMQRPSVYSPDVPRYGLHAGS